MPFVCIIEPYVSVRNIKLLNVAVETQKWLSFLLLSCCKMFVFNNVNVFRSSCQVPDIFCPILNKFKLSQQFFHKSLRYQISQKFFQWEPSSCMRTDGQTDGHYKTNGGFFATYATKKSLQSGFLCLDTKQQQFPIT